MDQSPIRLGTRKYNTAPQITAKPPFHQPSALEMTPASWSQDNAANMIPKEEMKSQNGLRNVFMNIIDF